MMAPSSQLARLIVVGILAIVSPVTAFAHGALKSSSPASGAVLRTAPRSLRLDFSEAPELAFTVVELFGPDGKAVLLDPLRTAGDSKRSVSVTVRGAMAAGEYRVVWRMAGSDGHPVRGRFSFRTMSGAEELVRADSARPDTLGEAAGRVMAPDRTAPAPERHTPAVSSEDQEAAVFGAESVGYVLIRWFQFTALLMVLGALAFNFAVLGLLHRKGGDAFPLVAEVRDRTAALGFGASVFLASTVVLRLFAQSYAMGVTSVPLMVTMLGTLWGWGWLLQTAGVVLALFGFGRASRNLTNGWRIAAVAGLLLGFTPALSGHAASVPRFAVLAIVADALHTIGAGGWLGSLLVTVAIGIPLALKLPEKRGGTAVAELVNAFSPTALLFAGLTAATGTFAAWLHLGSVPALWQSPYGRTLLTKLGVLSVVAGTGAYNWLRLKPTLGGPNSGTRLRRSASVEIIVGLVVLLVTAVLVATPTSARDQGPTTRRNAGRMACSAVYLVEECGTERSVLATLAVATLRVRLDRPAMRCTPPA